MTWRKLNSNNVDVEYKSFGTKTGHVVRRDRATFKGFYDGIYLGCSSDPDFTKAMIEEYALRPECSRLAKEL